MSLLKEPSVDFHLKLNEQSFHIPHELLKRNVKLVNKLVDRETKKIQTLVGEANAFMADHDDVNLMNKLNEILKSVELLERKLEKRLHVECELLHRVEYRIKYFKELDTLKKESNKNGLIEWYLKYTNMLIGDYLTRNSELYDQQLTEMSGQVATTRPKRRLSSPSASSPPQNAGLHFLRSQGLENLLDCDILITANRISKSLTKNHDLALLINWIKENDSYLESKSSALEFETRFQEYIELVKVQNYSSAITCFQTHLIKFIGTNFEELKLASGLLVFIKSCKQQEPIMASVHEREESSVSSSESSFFRRFFHRPILKGPRDSAEFTMRKSTNEDFERYMRVLNEERWTDLKDLFLQEYYSMYGISQHEPLLIYLSLGISTLKTRACMHTPSISTSHDDPLSDYLAGEITQTNCPVCSKEFSAISTNLPYAHHIQSNLFDNPVMLPNGNIYDAKKLRALAGSLRNKKLYDLQQDQVLDPIDQNVYSDKDFITMYPT